MTMTRLRKPSAASLFRGRNFMTPSVLRYGWKGNFAFELSQGEGFKREAIFGVTVKTADGESDYDKSAMFYSRDEAEAHIASLR